MKNILFIIAILGLFSCERKETPQPVKNQPTDNSKLPAHDTTSFDFQVKQGVFTAYVNEVYWESEKWNGSNPDLVTLKAESGSNTNGDHIMIGFQFPKNYTGIVDYSALEKPYYYKQDEFGQGVTYMPLDFKIYIESNDGYNITGKFWGTMSTFSQSNPDTVYIASGSFITP